MPLDLSKPVQTRDGRKVRILCTNRRTDEWNEGYVVVGLLEGEEGGELVSQWKLDGSATNVALSKHDLVNVPEPERTGWVNIYAHPHGHVTGTIIFDTRAQAVRMPPDDPSRIACIEVKYRPGQGIET